MVAIHSDAASRIATKSPVVAIVEDDDIFRQYLSILFKNNNCQVKEASCSRELFDILATQDVDCVVLDYNLDSENGLAVHARIKETMRNVPPIVMLTVERNERTIIKAFRGGISDYVLKDNLKSDELFKAVDNAIERRSQACAHEAELARLKRKSEFDDATGLYSRAAIDDRLAGLVRSKRDGRCAIILIAPDDLDAVRAKFGLVVADRALRAFVSRLKGSLGPYDIGGRYDDTRFISLTDVDVRFKTIELTCRKLAQDLAVDVNLDAMGFRITPLIGAAIYPLNGRDIGVVLAAAESALENARTSGKAYAIAADPRRVDVATAADLVAEAMPVTVRPEAASVGAGADIPVCRSGDRRSTSRHRVFKQGRIVLPNMCSAIDCTVRDISSKGARLRVGGHFIAPERFDLLFPATGERRHVLCRWQHGNEFGVQFVD
ncbi:MAG: response regulator [Rhodoplanes sp.]|uniref:response regulator n=1 Tax=Rhodoplanes sp. TaxID=1968906 RepID=UPI001797EE88|nr:response regulator [Rhodoplanes sp.]NVO15753.1 response regulator [Rhodoplanes sp.]